MRGYVLGLSMSVALGCAWVAVADDANRADAAKDQQGPALPQADTWMYGKVTNVDKDKHTFTLTGWHLKPEMRYTVFSETRGNQVFTVGVARPHVQLTGEKHAMQFMHSPDAPIFKESIRERAAGEAAAPDHKNASGWQNRTVRWEDLKEGDLGVVGFNAADAKGGEINAKAIVLLSERDQAEKGR
jgi:hypothetical protein